MVPGGAQVSQEYISNVSQCDVSGEMSGNIKSDTGQLLIGVDRVTLLPAGAPGG